MKIYFFLAPLVFGILMTWCFRDTVLWHLDPEYSMYLTLMNTNYKSTTGKDIATTVNILRIYRTPGLKGEMYSLSELFKKELILETTKGESILKFISATQDQIEDVENCFQNREQETFHVVMLDNTSMRAGYFLFYKCAIMGKQYEMIKPLQQGGGSSIYYNKALIPIFKELQSSARSANTP